MIAEVQAGSQTNLTEMASLAVTDLLGYALGSIVRLLERYHLSPIRIVHAVYTAKS
jgi:hypothetical protein